MTLLPLGLLIEDVHLDLLPPAHSPQARPFPEERFRQIVVHRDGIYRSTTWRVLERHLRAGFAHVGCHYYVPEEPDRRRGQLVVYQTLPLGWCGIGSPPNYHRLQVMLGGRVNAPVEQTQAAALRLLLLHLRERFNLRPRAVVTHRHLEFGACPGWAVQGLVRDLRAQ